MFNMVAIVFKTHKYLSYTVDENSLITTQLELMIVIEFSTCSSK